MKSRRSNFARTWGMTLAMLLVTLLLTTGCSNILGLGSLGSSNKGNGVNPIPMGSIEIELVEATSESSEESSAESTPLSVQPLSTEVKDDNSFYLRLSRSESNNNPEPFGPLYLGETESLTAEVEPGTWTIEAYIRDASGNRSFVVMRHQVNVDAGEAREVMIKAAIAQAPDSSDAPDSAADPDPADPDGSSNSETQSAAVVLEINLPRVVNLTAAEGPKPYYDALDSDALSAALADALPDDRIWVRAGSYSSTTGFTVKSEATNVVIEGPNAGLAWNDASRLPAAEAVISGLVELKAKGAKLDGFTLDSGVIDRNGGRFVTKGVSIRADEVSVANNRLQGEEAMNEVLIHTDPASISSITFFANGGSSIDKHEITAGNLESGWRTLPPHHGKDLHGKVTAEANFRRDDNEDDWYVSSYDWEWTDWE